jgi:hypothetical protein
MVERHIDEPACREEAAAAAVKIARAVSGAHTERATAVLEKVLRASKTEAVRELAREVMDHIERFDDHVTLWMASGPYTVKGKGCRDLLASSSRPSGRAAARSGGCGPVRVTGRGSST